MFYEDPVHLVRGEGVWPRILGCGTNLVASDEPFEQPGSHAASSMGTDSYRTREVAFFKSQFGKIQNIKKFLVEKVIFII